MSTINNNNWSTSLIGDVVDKIKENRIVPIIGSGVYKVWDSEIDGVAKYTSVQEFAVKSILSLDAIPLEPTQENIKLYSNGYRGMTELNKLCNSVGKTLRVLLKELFNDQYTLEKIKIDDNVQHLLNTGYFPLVLTTCNFRYLEKVIQCKEVEYQVVSYKKEKKANQDITLVDGKLDTPTIFHLFGYIGVDRHVVIVEDELLKYMHCIQDTNTCPKNLKDYVQDKYILSLGCDIPDWTFRFLLYSLKEENGNLMGEGGDDSFDGGALSTNIDQNLVSFLSDISYFSHNKVSEFVSEINYKIEALKKPGIFLSMNSEEYSSIGEIIKEKLREHFNVWFYIDHDNAQYWKEIEKGIKSRDYFMPVITDKTIVKLLRTKELSAEIEMMKDNPNTKGIIAEWMLASAHKKDMVGDNHYCIPFFLNTNKEEFKEILSDLDKNREILWPLFYPQEGAAALPCSTLEELTALKVYNHIKK